MALMFIGLLILKPSIASGDSENDLMETRRIAQKVSLAYGAALKIRVDGLPEDWSDIPHIASPADTAKDASSDIISVSFAPLQDRFLILIETRETPANKPWTFYVNLTLTKEPRHDFQIGFNGKNSAVRIFSRFTGNFRGELSGLKIAIGQVVEIELPYSSLLNLMKPDMKKKFLAERRAAFARVTAFTFDNAANSGIDEACSVASYYLSESSPLFDDELPRPLLSPVIIDVPVKNKWYVSNGAWEGTHEWEYDIHIRDAFWKSSTQKDSKNNMDFYAWDTEVFSPVDGTVSRIVNETEDGIPGQIGSSKGTNNGVWLKTAENILIYLVHMKKGSVAVQKKQDVKSGQYLGRTGSSGRSFQPHIHLGAGKLHSVRLRNVKVGINGTENDPWERTLDLWDIRRGYFFKAR